MAKNVRQRMVAGAAQLLATKGLQATSFTEVIELTDTPRGSIYHHFPGGKDELVLAALDASRQSMDERLAALEGRPARELLDVFFDAWRGFLTGNDYGMGCAVVAVTVDAEARQLLDAAGATFVDWEEQLARLWTSAGLGSDAARDFGSTLMSVTEGAVVICRAKRSTETLDRVQAQMTVLLESQLTSTAA